MSGLEPVSSLPPSAADYDRESSASSGQKRNRDGSPSQGSAFSHTVRYLVNQRCNIDLCWNCEAPLTELCHVVARRDPAFLDMQKSGMITFGRLGDYRNAISLCGSCHNHFDRTSGTGWVFLPTDLIWFIRWEEDDFVRRVRTLKETGKEVDRTYPNERHYEQYMRSISAISDPDEGLCRGGLYNRIILSDMFPPIMMQALRQQGMDIPGVFPTGSKRWYGAPMAAINRGFAVMGAPVRKLPLNEWHALRTLQDLYSRTPSNVIHERLETDRTSQGSSAQPPTSQSQRDENTTANQSNSAPQPPAQALGSGSQTSQLHDAPQDDNPNDSAVDVCTQGGKRMNSRQSRSSKSNSICNVATTTLHASRRNKRQKCNSDDSPREDRDGEDEDSWCFGPESSSNHKVELHVGW